MQATFLILIVVCFTHILTAQPIELDQDIFAQRRALFIEKMDSNAVAIFPFITSLILSLLLRNKLDCILGALIGTYPASFAEFVIDPGPVIRLSYCRNGAEIVA